MKPEGKLEQEQPRKEFSELDTELADQGRQCESRQPRSQRASDLPVTRAEERRLRASAGSAAAPEAAQFRRQASELRGGLMEERPRREERRFGQELTAELLAAEDAERARSRRLRAREGAEEERPGGG